MIKNIAFVGINNLTEKLRTEIAQVLQDQEDIQLVFLDDEQYNANINVLYKKLLKIKGVLDVKKFTSDPNNIAQAEQWREFLRERSFTLFRLVDFAKASNYKPSEAKELLQQLALFGLIEEEDFEGRTLYKFIPNDEARIYHYRELIDIKRREIKALEVLAFDLEKILKLKKEKEELDGEKFKQEAANKILGVEEATSEMEEELDKHVQDDIIQSMRAEAMNDVND